MHPPLRGSMIAIIRGIPLDRPCLGPVSMRTLGDIPVISNVNIRPSTVREVE